MKKNIVLLAVILGMTLPACARRVVLDPEVALQKNSADWTVKSEPRKVAENTAPATAAETVKSPRAVEKGKPAKSKKQQQ